MSKQDTEQTEKPKKVAPTLDEKIAKQQDIIKNATTLIVELSVKKEQLATKSANFVALSSILKGGAKAYENMKAANETPDAVKIRKKISDYLMLADSKSEDLRKALLQAIPLYLQQLNSEESDKAQGS